MRGAIPPLPNTSSWRVAKLSAGAALPFTILIIPSQRFQSLTGRCYRIQVTKHDLFAGKGKVVPVL
jgi:hypothetical protein